MTDRELLEAAAKAGGIALASHPFMHRRGDGALTADGSIWNPLTDDGDALRLAVKLKDLMFLESRPLGAIVWERISMNNYASLASEPYGDDPCAATRRAIVRAASETGAKRYLNTGRKGQL
jgi:hypothetical protein